MRLNSNFMKYFFQYSKVVIINILILYFLLFILELIINFNNNRLFNENKFYLREQLLKQFENVDVAFAPYKLLNKNYSLIPLSGVSKTKTILCEHNKKFVTYFSDQFGFNNKNLLNKNDIILLGDSYVHGLCQKSKDTLFYHITQNGVSAINLGIMSTGSLMQYATIKEYAKEYNYESIVWLFNPDNDFYDFSNEIRDDVLKKYFLNESFNQNLVEKDILKNNIIKNYLNYDNRRFKEFIRYYHIDLKQIRDYIQIFIDKYIRKKIQFTNTEYLNDLNLKKIIEIINKLNNYSIDNGKRLFFVINAIRPEIVYSEKKNFINLHKGYINSIDKVKKNLISNNIIFYDFNDYVYQQYNKENINTVFKVKDKGFDHFTSEGNNILAEKIVDLINTN